MKIEVARIKLKKNDPGPWYWSHDLKLYYRKKIVCGDVGQMIDPNINLKHASVNNMEEWLLGFTFKTEHQGKSKYISNKSMIEFSEHTSHTVKDYYLSDIDIPAPPRVRLNLHNIDDVHNAILELI